MLLLEVISGETLPKPDRGKMRFHKVIRNKLPDRTITLSINFPFDPSDRQREQSP